MPLWMSSRGQLCFRWGCDDPIDFAGDVWAALRFPDCCFRVLLCHKLLTHVLIADFVWCPVAKP